MSMDDYSPDAILQCSEIGLKSWDYEEQQDNSTWIIHHLDSRAIVQT